MALDLSSLKKAIGSFERVLNVASRAEKTAKPNDDLVEAVKAGVIQNFEFTYELCWKFMKRWMEINFGASYAEGVARRELFRLACENRLIDDVELWMDFHAARNQTSHTYDEQTAEDVFETATTFLGQAQKFLNAIEHRND
jgi:nucleotidyltransferase substrate binding protein (TIGR01987 family)